MLDQFKAAKSAPDFQVKNSWPVVRLWNIARLRSEKNRPDFPLLSIFLHRGVIQYGDGGGQVHKPGLDLTVYQVVRTGDFVLNNQQAWRGSVGVSKHEGIISPAYVVLDLSKDFDPRFADYLFQSRDMVAQYLTSSKGVGDIQRDIHMPWLKNAKVPLPSRDDQEIIVRFLDWTTGRLERTIRAKKRVISLLNEQKQSITQSAVTRGLDETVPFKDSGIPWIGEIPAHWETKRIKYLLREIDVRSASGAEPLLSMRMHHGLVLFAEHFTRPPQAATLVGFKIVRPGQFVVNRMQAGNGVIFASTLTGLVSPDYAVFEPIADADVEFLGELFRSRKVRVKFRAESKGLGTGTSGFLRLYTDRFGAIHVALPPTPEQRTILQGLSVRVAGVNTAISRLEREVELLREYRTKLIADVVTGKLDVRQAAAALPLEDLGADNVVGEDTVEADEDSEEFAEEGLAS
jgi:type I restriction enzyme S subunit